MTTAKHFGLARLLGLGVMLVPCVLLTSSGTGLAQETTGTCTNPDFRVYRTGPGS